MKTSEFRSGESIRLQLLEEWGREDQPFIKYLQPTFDALAPLVEPAIVQLSLCSLNPENYYSVGNIEGSSLFEARTNFLRVPIPTHRLNLLPTWEKLPRAEIGPWVHKCLSKVSPPSGSIPAWDWLRACPTAAAVCPGIQELELLLTSRRETLRVPVEDGRVFGPLERTEPNPPIGFTFARDGYSMDLTLDIYWTYWVDGPGKVLVEQALRRLHAIGWELDS